MILKTKNFPSFVFLSYFLGLFLNESIAICIKESYIPPFIYFYMIYVLLCVCKIYFQTQPLFSSEEMNRRLNSIRSYMEKNGLDACVFTSYYNIYYFSEFLYCSMGRQYALVITDEKALTITPCKNLSNVFVQLTTLLLK